MKKIIALTLVLILAVGLFAGCKSSDKGSVYFLNFKPEADSAWQALAKTYTEKTGVTVKVVTAASGTYETTLTAEMAKKDAPTLFQCGNETALDTWKDYCLALDGTEFLNEMTTSDFNLKGEDGNVVAIIGDGSLSGGEALEALDYAAELDGNLIILVNDNDMSIAENHGGLYQNRGI